MSAPAEVCHHVLLARTGQQAADFVGDVALDGGEHGVAVVREQGVSLICGQQRARVQASDGGVGASAEQHDPLRRTDCECGGAQNRFLPGREGERPLVPAEKAQYAGQFLTDGAPDAWVGDGATLESHRTASLAKLGAFGTARRAVGLGSIANRRSRAPEKHNEYLRSGAVNH